MEQAMETRPDPFLASLARRFELDPCRVSYDARLSTDLGLDSLALAELAIWLEGMGVELPAEGLWGIGTLRELLERSRSTLMRTPEGPEGEPP